MAVDGDKPTYGGEQFDVLLADFERNWDGQSGNRNYNSAHPDRAGLMTLLDLSASFPAYTGSQYHNSTGNERGKIDRSFLRTDGSVSTIYSLVVGDGRMARVPFVPAYPGWAVYSYLPAE
jgi:hypothetical protein